MSKLEGARCPHRPTGLSFRNRTAPSPHTGLRSLHSSRRTSNLARLAEERILKSDGKAGWFLPRPRPRRSGDVTRAGRAQPTTFLTLRAARQLAAAPRSIGVLRVLAAAAAPPNSRARAPKPGVAGGRAPQKAALAQGPQHQERRYQNRERARRRPRAPRGPHSARAPAYKQARPRARTNARSRAAPTRVPDLPPPPHKGRGRASPGTFSAPEPPRGLLGPAAEARPPAPARRCVGWARCLRPAGSPHPCPHCSPHPATSSPPPPPLYPPAPPHRSGPRFRRRRSKTDRIFPSQLPGRHLTFNPHSQWVPNAHLAITEASDPARVETASWPNLKGTLQPRREAWPPAAETASRARSVGRSAPPPDAPPCWAEPGPEIVLELEPGRVGAPSLLPGPTFCSVPGPPSVAQPHVGRGPVSCLR